MPIFIDKYWTLDVSAVTSEFFKVENQANRFKIIIIINGMLLMCGSVSAVIYFSHVSQYSQKKKSEFREKKSLRSKSPL